MSQNSTGKMPVTRALAIIDKHLPPETHVTVQSPPIMKKVYRNGRDFPPNPTLPAFYVQWRDGPLPYDCRRGDCQCAAADMWENTVDFDLVRNGVAVSSGDLGPRKGRDLLEEVARKESETAVKNNYFHTTVIPEEVHLNDHGTAEKSVRRFNPSRDRQTVEREVEADRTSCFFSRLKRKRATLFSNCLRNYPHGALGLTESPYGDPGEIYQEQQRRVLEGKGKAEHTMRGQREAPSDHMMGANRLSNEHFVRGRTYISPTDNLFASRIVKQEPPNPFELSDPRTVRFRSTHVPKDNLLGGVFLEETDM